MNFFHFRGGELYCEDVPVRTIADKVGTPFYLYSASTIKRHVRVFAEAFSGIDHLVCYSVKANSNLAVLRLMAGMGTGADIVSGGELHRAMKAGIDPSRIVFSGVGKTAREMELALEAGILMFNVESGEELQTLARVACSLGKTAPVAMRVNPDVDPKTHPYISTGLKKNKFGIPVTEALALYRQAAELDGIRVAGIDCHIGSQLTTSDPFGEAVMRLMDLIEKIEGEGIPIRYLDIGGGLGIIYDKESPPLPADYAETVLKALGNGNRTLILEPGRVIVGNSGILVTKVLYRKKGATKNFVIVDAAMNDLIRPSLYEAYQKIVPVRESDETREITDVVGPICESGDFLGRDLRLAIPEKGELLAVMSAGAYGFSMSSQYNSRPRAAEVMVMDSRFEIVRERETYEDLIRGERFFEE
ncbi:MAG: diaminopimelate decarboxylase [Proteobacteria bacterium]|nr:diaminopimelate decarboxylase [Pseudomonadota bacterium]